MSKACPELMEMLRRLIETPSVSCVNPELDMSNEPVVHLLASWLEDLGFTVELLPVPGHPGKANLIAGLGRGGDGLVLAGHTDTVPFDEALWSTDPFRLSEREGRLHGLGTADMKAFLGLALEAVKGLDPRHLKRPVLIVATADEESSMHGARALVQAGRPTARSAVIGEPTGMRPVRMHKGIMMEAIRVVGHSGHSSDPSLGANAIEGMQRVIETLQDWHRELMLEEENDAFAIPVPTMNLGRIHGGDNPNRICGECELQLDLRPLPGQDPALLREALRERVSQALATSAFHVQFRSLFDGHPALETSPEAAIVRAAESLTGHASSAVAFGTEGPYFKELGIESVVLGPGNIEQAHQPDEYLLGSRIEPTISLLRRFIEKMCM